MEPLKVNPGVENVHSSLLKIQTQLAFLKSATRLVGHFAHVPDDHPGKDIHLFCQGLSDRFEDLSRRVAAPGATEDPELLEIGADLAGIGATLDAITHFSPEMEGGKFCEPVDGLFTELFCYVSRRLSTVQEAWGLLG